MANNNIFEGAEFGDRFLTKGGVAAIYHYYNGPIMNQHNLIMEDGGGITCRPDGTEVGYTESVNDIVSCCQEPGGGNNHGESVREDAVKKAWNFIENNLLEYTGLDYATVEEAFYETMEG